MFGVRRLFAAIAVLGLLASACGDDDDSAAIEDAAPSTEVVDSEPATADTSAEPIATGDDGSVPADDGGSAAGGGLQVNGVEFEDGTAFILNGGPAPIDLADHWVCNRPSYEPLPAIELAPGEGIFIDVPGLSADGGEVAIYSSNNFGSSDAIISYVQWGGGGGRAGVAAEAGLWSGDPVDVAGAGIALVGEPGSAAGWE